MHEHHDHPHGDGLPARRSALTEELIHHLPFSVSAVAIGLVFAGIICFLTPVGNLHDHAGCGVDHVSDGPGSEISAVDETHAVGETNEKHTEGKAPAEEACEHDHSNPFFSLFHLFHPVHMLFSAAATTAMFWRYERRVLKAILVGLIGAIGVCGLSDIVMPHVSLGFLGKSVPWHICVIQHPQMVLSFAAVGILIGLVASRGVRNSTFFSHSLHVLASTMASVFYLIGPLGRLEWIDSIGVVFMFVVVAVMVPCCLSDIVFPLFLARRARDKYQDEHTGCDCHS